MKKTRFLILLLISFYYSGYAQKHDIQEVLDRDISDYRYRFMELRTHTGFHAYTGDDDLKTYLESGYGALEFRYGWQPSKKDHWSASLGYPAYGVGFYAGFLGSPEIFGLPNAAYGFMRFYTNDSSKRNVFTIEPALGVTYNLKPYNPESNPLNNAIGAKFAVYFNVKLGWIYKWTQEVDITYGLDATHMSNGRLFTPNYGLNMMGINLGLNYNYNADQHKVNKDVYSQDPLLPSRFKRPRRVPNTKYTKDNNTVNLYGAISTVQSYADQGTSKRFPAYSAVVEYQHKFNNVHSVSGGFDYFFDGSIIEDFPNDPSERNHYGVHVGYEFSFWRFSILGHLGTYLNENETKPPTFFRPALRYEFNKWAFAQVGLKAKGFAADWIEFGLGVKPFKW